MVSPKNYIGYTVGVVIASAMLYWAKLVVESKTDAIPTKVVVASCFLTSGSSLFIFVVLTEGESFLPVFKGLTMVLKCAIAILLGVAMGTQGIAVWAKLLLKRATKLIDTEEVKL
jgi:hypothetical protein